MKLKTAPQKDAAKTAAAPKTLGVELLEGRLNLSTASQSNPALSMLIARASSQVQTRIIPISIESETALTTDRTGNSRPKAAKASTVDPILAPILKDLHGDGQQDDYATLQNLIDTAYANDIKTITLPSGRFILSHELNFYGSGVTFQGQGTSTILDVRNSFAGPDWGPHGRAITAAPTFNSTDYMVSAPVTSNTITFTGEVPIKAGDTVFLTNGRGSTVLLERQAGGNCINDWNFKELAPDEYVTIASVTTNAAGQTVATLTKNVVGVNDYFNIAPEGAAPSENYVHVKLIDKPNDHCTIQNLAIRFTDMWADTSIYANYTNYLTIQNITVLNHSDKGGNGGMTATSTMHTTFYNINSPVAIGLNSSRFATITQCHIPSTSLEEGVTDSTISYNTFSVVGTCSIRVNDLVCARNVITGNTMNLGSIWTGAIAVAEATDITITDNVVKGKSDLANAGSIWIGIGKNFDVHGNTALWFGLGKSLGWAKNHDNSWNY